MALAPNKIQQAEFARVVFSVTPELGTTIKQVLDPKYWVHVAAKLKPRCRIEVLAEDFSWYAELLVVTSDKTWASMALLSYKDLTGKVAKPETADVKQEPNKDGSVTLDEFNTADHYVDYVQGQSKGRVIHRASKQVIKEGFKNKAEAAVFMRAHEAELAKQKATAEADLV